MLGASTAGFEYQGRRTAKVLTANSGAKISTEQSKFGGSSLKLTTFQSDWVTTPVNTDFSFGTGEFTVECWIYMTNVSNYRTIWCSGRQSSVGNIGIYIQNGNKCEVYNNGAGPAYLSQSFSFTMSTNTWYHFALTKSGSTMRVFIDGTLQGSGTTVTYDFQSTGASPAAIGTDTGDGFSFLGYIDDFCVRKGVATYTSNFTPRTLPIDCDNNTSLLAHFDGANNSTTFKDDNL
jgi:hypothetical protein